VTALLMDFRLLGLGGTIPVATVVGHLRPVAITALILAATTGLLLFSVQPLDYAANPAFLTKMLLLTCAIANAALVIVLRLDLTPRRFASRALATLSILLWVSVLTAGRFIGFFTT
jgi:hypothetical protein